MSKRSNGLSSWSKSLHTPTCVANNHIFYQNGCYITTFLSTTAVVSQLFLPITNENRRREFLMCTVHPFNTTHQSLCFHRSFLIRSVKRCNWTNLVAIPLIFPYVAPNPYAVISNCCSSGHHWNHKGATFWENMWLVGWWCWRLNFLVTLRLLQMFADIVADIPT